ncbi:MAG: 16S rRNA (cytidine(1402)-2'-O)-methyltransferase [Clostridiales bacterium]|jgi:16S rRNA (cytidine1402-2'-O)-methyltransferase|nr:16S rRNA (cytidine(1402)-2'-O)-methyltransferase [Clostridiales bacterium]
MPPREYKKAQTLSGLRFTIVLEAWMGTLYICGTPIGNLEDISARALRVLREVDCVAAEDTRHTLKLLSHYGRKTPLTSYHEHNKREKGPDLLRQLSQGRNIALVTDAGMPCISDPGMDLVKLCHDSGIPVVSVPGPSAVITALALSGMDTRRFAFEGFLPRERKKRREILDELRGETRTIVLYEAPHHLKETLTSLAEALGNRPAALARELTKAYEEVERADLDDLAAMFADKEPIGEYVIIINAREREEKPKNSGIPVEELVEGYIGEGFTEMEAIKKAAKDTGVGKREVYRAVKLSD